MTTPLTTPAPRYNAKAKPDPASGQIKGWHVLVSLLVFFGVIIGTNAAFMYYAVSTFPGEDVKKSYVQGREYNTVLDRRRLQAELGWQGGIEINGGADDRLVSAVLLDKAGQPIDGLTVTALLRRPATDAQDQTITLIGRGDGRYSSEPVADLSRLAGRWEVEVFAAKAETPDVLIFEAHRLVELQASTAALGGSKTP
jgi:nitrogen fixation protein FixH